VCLEQIHPIPTWATRYPDQQRGEKLNRRLDRYTANTDKKRRRLLAVGLAKLEAQKHEAWRGTSALESLPVLEQCWKVQSMNERNNLTGNNHKPEVVVITGASAGVGRATVQAFAQRGAHIGLLARGREGLEGARRDAEAAGGQALPLPTDVADARQVEAAAQAVEEKFGPIDIWVNDAMTTVFSPFKEITAEEFKRATEVTYLGAVYGTMAALRRMLPRDRGCIVQVGSALAYRSIPLQAPYCGAKHAIRGFTDSVRCELLHDRSNVHITMVHLPGLNTPQFSWCKTRLPRHPQPVPPIFEPEVAAEGIVWAAHHKRREVLVGGSTVEAVQGNKIAPGILDHYLARTAYDGQQTKQPVSPDRPSNLFEPVPGDHGAHGVFDSKARPESRQLWATTHRSWLALASAGVAGFACAFLAMKR
jgi:NAD(P)-dependent dehydrogenase (short-subunit alcohol dehydrogenase family)